MPKWGWMLALSIFGAVPAQAQTIQVNFTGQFANAFPGGEAYANGTGYTGSFMVDTSLAATTSTSNAGGTFARFDGVGAFGLNIGSDVFSGTVDVLTNDLTAGYDEVRFLMNVGNGFTYVLVYGFLPGSTVTGANLPTDLVSLSGTATGAISNAQMRGNFGPAIANASAVAVAEPATWGMMIGGFGLAGEILRRRKANARTSVSFA